MSICGVIFDLDGVLIDSAAAHRESWKMLGREIGIDVSDASVAASFGRKNRDIIPVLFGDDLSPQRVRELGARKEECYRSIVRGHLPVMEGAVELIQHYHAEGYKLAIGSSTERANIDLALKEMGAAEVFEAIVAGEDVSIGKPDPHVFLVAAEKLGLMPEQCMVIEDAPAGVEAALNANMRVVALLGSHPVEKLRRASRVIRHLKELIPRS